MKLDLNPEVEASLLAQAHARGLSLEAYLHHVLQTATADDIYVEKQSGGWAVKILSETPIRDDRLSCDRIPA
jgi:hypothetical protein